MRFGDSVVVFHAPAAAPAVPLEDSSGMLDHCGMQLIIGRHLQQRPPREGAIELIKSLGLTFPEIRRLQAQTARIFALETARRAQMESLAEIELRSASTLRWIIDVVMRMLTVPSSACAR